MSLLDLLVKAAIPFAVVSVIVSTAFHSWDRNRGIHRGAEGAARRDVRQDEGPVGPSLPTVPRTALPSPP